MDPEPKEKRNSSPGALPSSRVRRFETAGDASQELFDSFKEWSGAVGAYGVQTAYAVIAANWAVYGSTGAMQDAWAKSSLAVVIIFLALHLICTGWVSMLHLRRIRYANENPRRWEEEFTRKNIISSSWPYTGLIEWLGSLMRFMKVWAPVAGGALFILGLFF